MKTSVACAIALLGLAALLLTHSVRAGPMFQQPNPADGITAPPATVPSRISYQGQLTDATGAPLNGAYDMVFQFWSADVGGSQVGADIVLADVRAQNGVFSVQLDIPHEQVKGQDLWLRIQVEGQWLLPRQQLLPVPYALSLRPGARVEGDSGTGALFTVVSTNSGVGIQANSTQGIGLQATGATTGTLSTATARAGQGVAGIADNYSGIGVYGRSMFGTGVVGDGELGVKGTSHLGTGVTGEGITGVYGNSPTGTGVRGASQSSYGVQGTSTTGHAVYGVSTNGRGVYGASTGSYGVYGFSENNYGIYGLSTNSRAVYGSGNTGVYGNSTVTGGNGLYTPDNLFVGGSCTGCKLALVAQNGGGQPIEPGDVVVLAGMAAPLPGQMQDPVVVVRRADGDSSAVAFGVATERYVPADVNTAGDIIQDGHAIAEPARHDDYLIVVYQGLVRVKADARAAPIAVGDTVALAAGSALASKAASNTASAKVTGLALEPLAEKTSLIWVLLLRP